MEQKFTAEYLDGLTSRDLVQAGVDGEEVFWLHRIAVAATRIAEAQELRLATSQVMQEQTNRMMELLRQLTAAGQKIELHQFALEAAVRTLRAFHREPGWDLYYHNAPELAPVRAVLGPEWKP